jgi:hypothetical protein
VCRQLSPGESEDRSRHMTTMMSANESGVGVVGTDGEDLNPGEADGGAPRHSSRFAAVSRSLSRSASMQGVADDNLIVVARLRRRENGRMIACVSRVSLCLCSKRRSRRG